MLACGVGLANYASEQACSKNDILINLLFYFTIHCSSTQLSCCLCLLNLLLLALNPALAVETRQVDFSQKNMDVMKKQVQLAVRIGSTEKSSSTPDSTLFPAPGERASG